MAAKDYRKGGIPYGFVAFPKDVLNDPRFFELQASSKLLLFDVAAQYTGENNGRLCPSFEVMRYRGWNSKHTLRSAIEGLLECPFVIRTRMWRRPRTAEWLGLTFWKLNWHESMDGGFKDPRSWPYLNFVCLKPQVEVQKHDRSTSKSAAGGAGTASMERSSASVLVQKLTLATEVKAANPIGAETAPVLDVAISAAVSSVPRVSPVFKGGPSQLGSGVRKAAP